MKILKAIFGFLFSRFLWTLIGLALLCALIWWFGPLISIGEAVPLGGELTRLIVIGLIIILWLFWILIGQLRAARANRMFVTDLAAPATEEPLGPGEENIAEVNEKFQDILVQLKRSKLGSRKFLRDMPWYMFIGPPGTGKTTALRQSGLHFPIDLSDDLKGVGGTRNCDWFFTEEAVLIDTAGRYVEQQSDPDVDAAEWQGFLAMLRKHRGRRALNGVIVTLSVQELLSGDAELRIHGREIRKRLAELREKLGIQLPIYLMITKADLLPGFESFFGNLSTREREQVWGATLGTEMRIDGVTVEREMKALLGALETRLSGRMGDDLTLAERGQVFRFPAQLDQLTQPMKLLIDTVFGESRYEESPWLRGFYFSSATQEGSPIDRMVGGLAETFGLSAPATVQRQHGEKRSFFLRNMLGDLVFKEAGLGTFDPKAEERRTWIWRGTLAGASLVGVVASLLFLFSYFRSSGALEDQERQLATLSSRLANVAARQAPTEPLDLNLALDAVTEVVALEADVPASPLTVLGPTANSEIDQAQGIAYDRVLRNILEPRMTALLEATMWRQIRDPENLLGALKVYQMMTGLAPYDTEFATTWWQTELPLFAPIDPFPTEASIDHQIAALDRAATDENRMAPDQALVVAALDSICTIPLAVRAYNSLKTEPEVAALPDWIPAEFAGPNGARVFTRLSEKTLRVGLPGAYSYDGFHKTVLPLIPEIAAQAALDRIVFAGGCSESSDVSSATLEADITKLYYEDYIAQWDGLLRDIRLAPITDLNTARNNLKDLSSADSALNRLLTAVIAETHLSRSDEAEGAGAANSGLLKLAQKRLKKLNKLAKVAKSVAPSGGKAQEIPGAVVADHFASLRALIQEIDGQPPLFTDTVAALTALSNELQTVSASPDPEAALLARGGLPQLTGAVANEATSLPDPINAWIGGIAGDTIAVTREAVIAQLNARWRADVLPFCTSATSGRYPFDQTSRIDVNISDFARLFGPDGLIDGFTKDNLLAYIDTTTKPWSWRADFGLDGKTLQPFENARAIRNGLFAGGAGPIMAFTLEPKDLSANASRTTLNVDGQSLVYFNSAARPTAMTWPGSDGTNMITLSFSPVDGTAEAITSETGAWAILRLFRKGQLRKTELPELFKLRLAASGFSADFELRANSVENPFDLGMFGSFVCPKGF